MITTEIANHVWLYSQTIVEHAFTSAKEAALKGDEVRFEESVRAIRDGLAYLRRVRDEATQPDPQSQPDA